MTAFTDATPPVLTYRSVWSATDCFFFSPDTMTWAGGTVTVNAVNHYLKTGDVINLTVPGNAGSEWVLTSKTVTVVDANSFTFPNVGALGNYPAAFTTIDAATVNKVVITCQVYSKLMFKPTIIQVEQLPVTHTIVIKTKVHPSASWVTLGSAITDVTGLTQVVLTASYNIVRIEKTVGAGQPVVYAQ